MSESAIAHAIVAERVTKRFEPDARAAVDGVSFTVDRGELVVLLGPSGCGKTTLLKMVNRLYEPTSGRILMDGRNIADEPATELRRRIGYVIQETGLFPHMTIEANIAVVPRLLGWDSARIDGRVGELLTLLGLPESYRTRRPRQLSGGERQRVGIARAMAADPALMLMDEPFGALDAITRLRLQDEFLGVQRQVHKTVLFVTHDVDEAMRLADRIMVLRAGCLVQYDTPLRIVSAPVDGFVVELLKTDDALRRLGLLTVGALLPAGGDSGTDAHAIGDGPTVAPGDSLRTALARLLAADGEPVTVVGPDGHAIARLGFDEIRAAAVPRAPT